MSTGVAPEHGRPVKAGHPPAPAAPPPPAGVMPSQGVRRQDQPLQQPTQEQAQEFDSWRHQAHQGYNPMSSMASDPYLSSFYAGSYHYPGFGLSGGDGTWSNGGDHLTFLGSYGGVAPGEAVPQPYGADLSGATMFGAAAAAGAAGGFGAFTQPAGYGFDFHTAAGAGYSQWGVGHAGYPGQQHPEQPPHVDTQLGRQGRVAAAEQAMQGLSIAGQAPPVHTDKDHGPGGHLSHQPKHDRHDKLERQHHENGHGHSKKMSWANIASQPAKPPPPPSKTKKPGVLPPPVVVGPGPGKPPNMDIGTWESAANHNGVPPPPVITSHPPPPVTGPPPKLNGNMNNRNNNGMVMAAGPARVMKAPPPFGQQHTNGNVHHGPPPSPPSHPVLDELKSVNDYNPREFDLNPKNARFFVLKSYSEDDIHRSIKYEIWCSTEHGNKRLDSAFKERDGRGPVFLFYSVNGSGHFCGMAQMLSALDYNSSAGVWAQDKWKGQFKVKWIYVKDVPNSQLRHIRLENNENKPVTNSRDTQEVPTDKGKMVLKIIHSYKHATSIFDDFIHYEKRQEEDEVRKPTGPKNSYGRDRHDGYSYEDRGHSDNRQHRDRRQDFRQDDRRQDYRQDDHRQHRQEERRQDNNRQDRHHRDKDSHGHDSRDPHHRENGDGQQRDRDSAPKEVRGDAGERGGERRKEEREKGGHGKGRGGGSNQNKK